MVKTSRILIKDALDLIGKEVVLKGWVNVVRDHGKITFIDLRDRSGVIQCVGENLPKATPEDAVEIIGKVKERPEKLVNPNLETGKIEIQVRELTILAKSAELPLDMGSATLDVSLPVLLDNRALTLKHPKVKQIFEVQAAISESFREAAEALGCMEVFTPTIAASATEGGAEVFSVDYYGHKAFMIQSPQLYKQIAVGAFERVYLFSHAYRAEPSVTTRHLSESTQLDCEIAFIDSFEELLDALEFVGSKTILGAANKCSTQRKRWRSLRGKAASRRLAAKTGLVDNMTLLMLRKPGKRHRQWRRDEPEAGRGAGKKPFPVACRRVCDENRRSSGR